MAKKEHTLRTIVRRIIIIALFFGILVYTFFRSCGFYKARGVEDFPRKDLIAEIKKFEKQIGYMKDINFHSYNPSEEAYHICYSTGTLNLPNDYTDSALKTTKGKKEGCADNANEEDVFFYKSQAYSGGLGLQRSLAEAPLERFIVVVFHEDYHEEIHLAHGDKNEAATTMMGMALAIDFAREKYGEDSEMYRNLCLEPALYIQKAIIVNKYYSKLRMLYANFNRFQISKADTLKRKAELLNELQKECIAIRPWPKTFNPCPPALNNAGLAFDITYTRHFPRMYAMWVRCGKDSKKLFDAFQQYLPETPVLPE